MMICRKDIAQNHIINITTKQYFFSYLNFARALLNPLVGPRSGIQQGESEARIQKEHLRKTIKKRLTWGRIFFRVSFLAWYFYPEGSGLKLPPGALPDPHLLV